MLYPPLASSSHFDAEAHVSCQTTNQLEKHSVERKIVKMDGQRWLPLEANPDVCIANILHVTCILTLKQSSVL